jgi:predicted nucleotidyltransferase
MGSHPNPNSIFSSRINDTISLVEYSFRMSSRQDVAREAARVLYNRSVKEYKDAKEIAAASLGSKALPSNYEVAIELDRLTDELEGSERQSMLIKMRERALKLMKALGELNPVLIGSVWRGTVRKGSDIDIVVYNPAPDGVKERVSQVYEVTDSEHKTFTMQGFPMNSVHIIFKAGNFEGEVVVRPPEDRDAYRGERCETFGDLKKGIRLPELEKLMSTDPLRRFIPKRRNR